MAGRTTAEYTCRPFANVAPQVDVVIFVSACVCVTIFFWIFFDVWALSICTPSTLLPLRCVSASVFGFPGVGFPDFSFPG